MAKTSASSSRSPFSFNPERAIWQQDVEEVADMLNFAAGENVQTLAVIQANEDTGMADPVHGDTSNGITFDTAAAAKLDVYNFWVWIDEDIQQVRFLSETANTSPAAGDVICRLGGGTFTNSHAATGTVSNVIATSTIGTGWQEARIDLDRTSASTNLILLRSILLRGETIAATSLPDPSG